MIVGLTENVLITNRGGGQPRRVPVADLSCSWNVNKSGTMSFHVPAEKLNRFGIDDYLGKWVYWEHPDLGVWAGVINADPVSGTNRTIELSAKSFHRLLEKRRTPRRYGQDSAPPGALALRAISDTSHDDYLFLRSWTADESGAPIDWEWRGEELAQVITSLCDQGHMEYDVTSDREFVMRSRLGRDLHRRVHLVEGVSFDLERRPRDLDGMINDRLGIADNEQYENSAIFAFRDVASIHRYGTQQDSERYAGMVTESAIRPRVVADLKKLAMPQAGISGTVVNVTNEWRHFIQGDSLRFVLPTANKILKARVMSRAYSGGTLTIQADVEAEL